MTEVNPMMVQTLVTLTGKTEAEVIKFLEKAHKEAPPVKTHEEAKGEVVISKDVVTLTPKNQEDKHDIPPVVELELAKMANSSTVKLDEVITEEVPLENLTQEQIEDASAEDTFSSTIRPGSKVRIVWEPNVGKGKIKWTGRVGTVIQKLSDSGISIYEIEFPAGKIPFQRINKETGKLQKGYHTKKLKNWFDEANIELVF